MTLKQRIKFFFQGKPYLKIITIILSAVAFAFCSIGTTGLTTDRVDYMTDAILNIPNYTNQATPGITIIYDHYSDNALAEKGSLSQRVIDIIEQNTSRNYLYGYYPNVSVDLLVSMGGFPDDSDREAETYNIRLSTSPIVAGSQSAMEEWGFSLVAGSYPAEVNQLAISEAHFELFKKFGYVDSTELFYYSDLLGSWRCSRYESEADDVEIEEINDYSDIIGKKVVFYGSAETDEVFTTDTITTMEIVGIINTDTGNEVEGSKAGDLVVPGNKLYFSEAWREAYFKRDGVWNDNKCNFLYTVHPKNYAEAYSLADACVKATDYVKQYSGDTVDLTTIVAPHFLETVLVGSGYPETFALMGTLLGVIAVVLQFFAVNNSFAERRKQVGVLQSLGAGKKILAGIFVSEIVATSLCMFILAVPTAYGIFYGYIYGATYNLKYLVHRLVYTPVNLLILAALCFILPMMAALVSIFRFLKRAPIDNIRKFKKIRSPHISREEKKRQRDLKKLQELKDKYENS